MNVVAWMMTEFETTRILAFDVPKFLQLTPRDAVHVATPNELENVYGVDATCDSAEALEVIAKEAMSGGEWLEENARPMYVAGLVLCAVVDVLSKTQSEHDGAKTYLRQNVRRDVAAVVACIKHVRVTRGAERMRDFLYQVAMSARSTGVEQSFRGAWQALLPYFTEATLYCRAKDAPGLNFDFDARAGITTWAPGSALGSVLGNPPEET